MSYIILGELAAQGQLDVNPKGAVVLKELLKYHSKCVYETPDYLAMVRIDDDLTLTYRSCGNLI